MKKLFAILLCALMLSAVVFGIVACDETPDGGDAKYTFDITVWVGEETKALTENIIKKFNETNTQSIKFNATVNEVTEGRAAGDVLAKPADAPEIFCFAQDQIARLVSNGMLATLSNSAVNNVKEAHSASAVKAATVGNTMYAYPLTEDNGYFLYYDKRVVSDEQAKTVEGIIEACNAKSKTFSFNLTGDGAGWYVSSFFYAAGAQSEWTTNDNGKFTAQNDTFNSDNGVIAMKGINKVVSANCYLKNGKASDFNAATAAGAVVSGVWDYDTAKNALGDNLGIAKLPTYEAGGKTYQLVSYLGCKMLGVTPQKDANKAAALSLLAQYLTNAESQMERFNALGWGPSAKSAQANADVVASKTLTALKVSATVSQGQYPANWWAKVQTLALRAGDATTDTAIKTALETYASELAELLA